MRMPKIYDHFYSGQIFTIEEARDKLQTTGNTLRKRLSELAARGYIYPIRQGLYRLSRPGIEPNQVQSSSFAIAAKLTPYCYVGFRTALQLHAGEIPAERDTIYVVSPTKFNSFAFEGKSYFWCQAPDPHGVDNLPFTTEAGAYDVLVTNYEKTIIDCLRRPAHSPHFPEFVKLCTQIEKNPSLDLLMDYADKCGVAALYNRLGFFLERMQDLWDVSEVLLDQIEKKMSRKITEWPIFAGSAHGITAQKFGEMVPPGEGGELRESRWRVALTGLQSHLVSENLR